MNQVELQVSDLDQRILVLCAVRLDRKVNAERFIELIDKVVEAAKAERKDQIEKLLDDT